MSALMLQLSMQQLRQQLHLVPLLSQDFVQANESSESNHVEIMAWARNVD
jgi:hypothetical protein